MLSHPSKIYRVFEIIPGLLVWTTFILGIVISIVRPIWVLYFMTVFSLYWLFKVLYFIVYVLYSWREYRRALCREWLCLVKRDFPEKWQNIYHLVVLPTAKEGFDVLDTTFAGLVDSTHPSQSMIVVLSGEERGGRERFLAMAKELEKKYAGKFHKIISTVHPDGVVGEIKGKGANAHWAGHRSKEVIDQLGIPYDDIIVSYFDCDTVVHPQYFAHLTYTYLKHPHPTRVSYQPVVLYNNNIWDAPAITRVAAFGTVFWLMTELGRPERLFTFSSHSMSWRALVDVNFWQKDIVTDDSRIFLQCFLRYSGDYGVVPLYIPVSMDTVMSDTYWGTMKNLYKQQRRWAWGVEHIPFMLWNFFFVPNQIPLRKKLYLLFNQFEGMYTWATVPILLFVLGYLPLLMIEVGDRTQIIVENGPRMVSDLMTLAMAGMFVSSIVSLFLLPERPVRYGRGRSLVMALQWLLLPVTLIFFGAFPAIESQTRLMLGKYLGFWVTEKTRK
ncbi:MAG: Uncharacterized protein G01um101418_288 [Parcubacteria group bacterium Gr01-1014_18]|nr:MAG: Uncharacterized protein Greene041636_255 [Parcubacteria group bacterium Greene0416_36]TSC81306.1 MAG: Uncharacterized protein G01um101418_288 [Parcubacteria group bacterium Gr01-1014_18]TSC99328.1 MAG: Uncharacterized protein Greene101420_256 [Parcubacteria group bacterium Greene1014_20]TSD06835.1 MAG: Uncharacterized protein Greene07142_569 [Parcubacteria group bacterium Greene0714_2]